MLVRIGGAGGNFSGSQKGEDCQHDVDDKGRKPLFRHARACPEHLLRLD